MASTAILAWLAIGSGAVADSRQPFSTSIAFQTDQSDQQRIAGAKLKETRRSGPVGIDLSCGEIRGAIIDPDWFGANGDDDLDDSRAIQNAFDCLQNKGRANKAKSAVIRFKPGRYIFNHAVALKNIRGSELRALAIEGSGSQVTVLVSRNSNGILHLGFLHRRHTVSISGLGFEPNMHGSGIAFEMTQPEGGNQHRRSLIARDIEITTPAGQTNYFDRAISLFGAWRPLIENVFVSGPYGPRVTLRDLYGMQTCFHLEESYRPTLMNSKCWSARNGAVILSQKAWGQPGPEGLMITHSNFVEVETGIIVKTAGGVEPEATITHNHINASKTGLLMVNRKFAIISNNLFYFGFGKQQRSQRYVDLRLVNTHLSIVSENIFHVPVRNRDFDGQRVMIVLENASKCMITRNVFNSPGTAVKQKKKSRQNTIFLNSYFRGARKI